MIIGRQSARRLETWIIEYYSRKNLLELRVYSDARCKRKFTDKGDKQRGKSRGHPERQKERKDGKMARRNQMGKGGKVKEIRRRRTKK